MRYTQYRAEHPFIHIAGLSKSFGTTPVIRSIDLTVNRGEIFALLGANGAGKTTLVNILSTLLKPDGGSATIAGYDVVQQDHDVRGVISLTGQYAAVDELLTARENLHMMAQLNGIGHNAASRTENLLDRFDLTAAANRRVGTFSGGMRRRLDIAVSLVSQPDVLFLDEPTTGLDPRSRGAVWQFVRDLADSGTTVLLTTQYLEEADQLADRIAVLHQGSIVANGTPTQLKSQVGAARLKIRFDDGTDHDVATDGSITQLHALLGELLSDTRTVSNLELRTPTLDDAFLVLTQDQSDHRDAEATAMATEGSYS